MRIILVSGDGIGAGKSTLAKQLGDETWSLAGAMRTELQQRFPNYDWWNRTQEYKANTRVKEMGDKTVRQVLIEYGQMMCAQDKAYWVRKLADRLEGLGHLANGVSRIAVDDVRKVLEVEHIRSRFRDVVHYHVSNPAAVSEAEFENDKLRLIADYNIEWKKQA